MTALYQYLTVLANMSNMISILACLYMFYSYHKLPFKNFGAKMIITLSIADFLFHSSSIINAYIPDALIRLLSDFISDAAVRFSVFWSFCIALILYKLLSNKNNRPITQYYNYCWWTVISFTVILSLINWYYSHVLDFKEHDKKRLIMGIVNSFFIFSMLLTLLYYIKSIRSLKETGCLTTEATQKFANTLYQYALVQFITVGPKLIYAYYSLLTQRMNIEILTGTAALFGFTGFANSLVYFFKRDGFGASSCEDKKKSAITTCESFYENHDTTFQLQMEVSFL